MPADISIDKEVIHCQTDSLSLKGALIIPDLNQETDSKHFHSFFHQKNKEVLMSLRIKEEEKVELPSRIAFTERTPQDVIKNAGLMFKQIQTSELQILEALLNSAA